MKSGGEKKDRGEWRRVVKKDRGVERKDRGEQRRKIKERRGISPFRNLINFTLMDCNAI